MSRRVISAVLSLRDQNFSSGLRRANSNASEFGRHIQQAQNKVENFSRSASKALKTVGAAAGALAATGVATMSVGVAKTMMDMETSFANLQAATGAAGTDLNVLKKAATETFNKGYGENIAEVTNAVARVKQNMRNIDNGEIARVTSDAMMLGARFESDVNEVTRGVNNTMAAFGISSTKAFDLFTKGGQRGLNFSNEMFDNMAEYAPLAKSMGYSAEEYFGILERGAGADVYNLDYINDLMKEFQIKIKDDSKSTNEAMGSLSKETRNVWTSFLEGKGTVADTSHAIVSELKAMDNQVEAGRLGVALFGTKFEDLEADAVYAMLGTRDAMEGFEGSTAAAAAAIENTFTNRLKSAWRTLQTEIATVASDRSGREFLNSIASFAEDAIPKVVNLATEAVEFGNTVRDNWGPIRETIIGLTTAVLVFKGGMATMTVVNTVTGFLAAYRKAAILGTGATTLFSAALRANPVGLVITAIAALTAGIVLLYRNSDKFRAGWDTAWTSIKKTAAGAVNTVIEEINRLIGTINRIPGVNIPVIAQVNWGSVDQSKVSGADFRRIEGSYAVGSNRITHDHAADVHEDEMIIPARQAQRVRAAGGTIDNIDKLITGKKETVITNTTTNNQAGGKGETIIHKLVINAKGITVPEVMNEVIPQLKLAFANR